MSQAKTIANYDREMCFDFEEAHLLEENIATEAHLPTILVSKRIRKRRANMYRSKHYVEFICFVESTYLQNLTLEMMTAYMHGNLINVMKRCLMENKDVIVKITTLCNNDSAMKVFVT